MKSILSVENINFSYDTTNNELLSNISLNINNKDRICICGENGSGKSTLLKVLSGIIKTKSKFIFKEKPIKNIDLYKKKIAYIPDNPLLYEPLNAKENIDFICNLWGIKNKEQYWENVISLCERLHFDIDSSKIISKYSLGMKSKLFLISMLARDTDILFLDEPLTSLDKDSQQIIIEILKEYSNKGKAIVFISHINSIQEELSNKIYYLINGCLQERHYE